MMSKSQALSDVVDAAREAEVDYRRGYLQSLGKKMKTLANALAAYDAAPDEDAREVAQRITRKIAKQRFDGNMSLSLELFIENEIAVALTAAAAQQREADARIADDAGNQFQRIADNNQNDASALHIYSQRKYAASLIAAAIRGKP